MASTVSGSPCDPRFVCEAYSQSQYQCVRCADPTLGPPGDCRYFTCLAGGYCRYLNEVSSARFIRQPCPAGSYCAANSTAPTPCIADAGQYCPNQNMSEPASCNPPGSTRSTYCSTPLQLAACPPGSFCAVDSIAQPCPAGTFSSDFGVFACDSCPSKWYTSNSGSTKCSTPSPMMIGLVCFFIVIFLACCACGWKIFYSCTESFEEELELKRRRERNASLIAQKKREELQRQNEEQEKIAKEVFKREHVRVKEEVLERLLRDLRMDLELRYPQGIQAALPTVRAMMVPPGPGLNGLHSMEGAGENNEVTVHIACEGTSSAAVVPVKVQTPMQAYEQFITNCITAEFYARIIDSALDILATAGKPALMNAIDLHRSLMGVRSLVLESYQIFTAIQKEQMNAQQETEESPGSVDRYQMGRNAIRQRLSYELNEHASAWVAVNQINLTNHLAFYSRAS